MKSVILYKAEQARGHAWRDYFLRHGSKVDFLVWPDKGDPAEVRYLATWDAIADLDKQFPNLEVLFSTGAGVDQFDLTKIPQHIQIVRMMDPAIASGMREYVSHAVLSIHRDMFEYRIAQSRHDWLPRVPRSAADVCIGVMGVGSLGRAVLNVLGIYGYSLRAWSRSGSGIDGVESFAGDSELEKFASGCDIVVCLLPLTDQTRGILGWRLFAAMPKGAGLINVGRGGHLQEDDLLEALTEGQIDAAILDVISVEPLMQGHAFWDHPRIVLTPHIASVTGHDSAAAVLLDNVRRHEHGETMTGVVNRSLGY